MSAFQYANNPQTTLSGSITAGATSLSVASAADFPTQGQFTIIIESEILLVTGVLGTTFTVTRGYDGTSAASHTNNSPVTGILTKRSLLDAHHIDVRSFGATGDGSTDDTAALNNAIAAATAGSVVFLPKGTYRTTSKVVLASEVTLRGEGDASVIKVDHTGIGIEALGSLGTLGVLASNATVGSRTAVLAAGDGAGYAAGDFVWIQSEGLTAGKKRAEIAGVESVSTDTLTLQGSLLDTYSTVSTGKYAKVTPVRNVALRDFAIYNTTYASAPTTDTEALIRFQYTVGAKIVNVTAYENNASGIGVIDSRDVTITGSTVHTLREAEGSGIFGYGVIVGGASRGITVSGCTFRYVRHAFTTSSSGYGIARGCTVAACTISDTVFQGLDTHEEGQNITFAGNTITGCQRGGINVRALDVMVTGNNIYGCTTAGIGVQSTALRTTISGNNIRQIVELAGSFGNGIFVTDVGSVTIVGNTISQVDRAGIRLGDGDDAFADVVISGNFISAAGQVTATSGIVIDGTADSLTITGNIVRDSTDHGLLLTAAVTGVANITLSGNSMPGNTNGAFSNEGTNNGIQAWANSPTTMPGHVQQATAQGTSIAVGGEADVTVTLPHSYSDTDYVAIATTQHSTNPEDITCGIKTKNTGSVVVRVFNRHVSAAITPTINVLTIHN